MRVIVGLGNPGSEYEHTRHNIGFEIADAVARKVGVKFKEGRGEFLIAGGEIEGNEFRIVKPLTYMNNSGIAVGDIVDQMSLNIQDVLVLVDDFHIPLGTLRIRRRGSSGGHNGLYSIIYHLQSDEFPRLRFGIGNSSVQTHNSGIVDFVLSQFSSAEEHIVQDMIVASREAVLTVITEGIETAVNCFNTQKK